MQALPISSIVLRGKCANEIRSTATGEVPVDHVIMQEKGIMQKLDGRSNRHDGLWEIARVAIGSSKRTVCIQGEGWSDELPTKSMSACK